MLKESFADQPTLKSSGLTDDSKLRLFPVVIHQISEEDYMVFRIGGSRITSVATSAMGAKTIRLLRRGKTIRQAKKILCRRLGIPAGELELSPVLDAIVAARMVRTADGRVLEAEPPSVRRMISHSLQFSVQKGRDWGRIATVKFLPAKTAHQLLSSVELWRCRRSRRPATGTAYENLRRAFGNYLPRRVIEAITVEHHCEQVRRAVDVQLLRNLAPPKMVRWLQDSVQFTGLDRLLAAQEAGRGVILCGFHFGAPQLLVPFLWRRGISFVGAAAIPPVRGRSMAAKLLLDQTYAGDSALGCGTVTWYTRFSFRGIFEMMKAVERGETALVFPDGYFTRPNREIARYFGHLAAEYRPAQTAVPFLGQTILANLMVPWLCQQTRAPVLPVKLIRNGAGFEVVIEPPLDLASGGSLHTAAEKLYGALERDIYLHPASWNYWSQLHEFATASSESVEELARKHPLTNRGERVPAASGVGL